MRLFYIILESLRELSILKCLILGNILLLFLEKVMLDLLLDWIRDILWEYCLSMIINYSLTFIISFLCLISSNSFFPLYYFFINYYIFLPSFLASIHYFYFKISFNFYLIRATSMPFLFMSILIVSPLIADLSFYYRISLSLNMSMILPFFSCILLT